MLDRARHIERKMIPILVILSLYLLLPFPSISQVNNPEILYVQFDKPFYLTGEKINYKVYLLNDHPAPSAFVHMEVLGTEGNILIEQVHRISDNTAYGSIDLPYDWEEGYYTVRCYTLWNLNFDNEYTFIREFPVFNEWEEMSSLTEADLFMDTIPDDYIAITHAGLGVNLLNRDEIHPGDSVYLHIEINDGSKAHLSIAVLDLNLIRPDQAVPEFVDKPRNGSDSKQEDLLIPPEKSIRIAGRLTDPFTGQPVRSSVISVYHPGEALFSRLKSRDGSFTIELSPFRGSKELQFIDMNPFQSTITEVEIVPYSINLPPVETKKESPARTRQVKKYLYYSTLRRKITEIFDSKMQDSLSMSTRPISHLQPDRTYDMADFRYIKNVEEFVSEGVPNSSTVRKDGQRQLRLFNEESKKFFMSKPWMMVDDYFILEDSIAYNIPFVEVSRIDIYNTNSTLLKYFDPIMIQGGVVAVYTKNKFLEDHISEMSNMVVINGLQERNFQDSPSGTGASQGGPDLDPVIVWDPLVLTGSNGERQYAFRMNDVTGTCLIHIEGVTQKGELVRGEMTFTVVP